MQQNADIGKTKSLINWIHQHTPFSLAEFSEFANCFSNRYFNPNGSTFYTLNGLKFRPSQNKQAAKAEVEAVLKKTEQDPANITKALFIILYRFRNNLFLGEKKIVGIEDQIDNFIAANNILKIILQRMKNMGIVV